jgi:hypothetical protein
MTTPSDDPRFLTGIELLRSRKWFDAHEALEDLWGETEPGAWREFLQGLIQHAVALEHLQRGNALGCFNVWSKARGKLKALDDWVAGVGVGPWSEVLVRFYTDDVGLADRVRQQLEGGVAAGEEHIDMGALPPLETWPQPPLSSELEARLDDRHEPQKPDPHQQDAED